MTALVTDNLPLLAGAPNGIKKLRELILELAVHGKLVPQDPSDEPASELLKRLAEEKARLVAEGKIKKQKQLADVNEDEVSFTLPRGWNVGRLGVLSHLITKGTTPTSIGQSYTSSGISFVKVENIELRRISNTAISQFISPETDELMSRSRLKSGDVLFSIAGTIGKICSVHESDLPANTNQALAIIRGTSTVFLQDFLLTQLDSFVSEKTKQRARGGAMPNVSLGDLSELALVVPPLAEQHRIVAKVDEIMALCDRLEAQQADADSAHAQLVQAVLDSLTQATDAADFASSWQRLSEHFHTLFTTEPSIDALKQTLLQLAVMGKLVRHNPDEEAATSLLMQNDIRCQAHTRCGWAKVPLGHLGEVIGGSTPSKGNAAFWDGDIPWVSPKDMKRPVIQDSIDHVSAKALAVTSLKAIPPKSLLMVVRGMILAHSFPVALTGRTVTINQDIKALVPPAEISAYMLLYLQAAKTEMVRLVDRSSHGTCKLVSEKLWSHIVLLPPLAEQNRIIAKVDQLMFLCDQLKTRLTQARKVNQQLASTLIEQAISS